MKQFRVGNAVGQFSIPQEIMEKMPAVSRACAGENKTGISTADRSWLSGGIKKLWNCFKQHCESNVTRFCSQQKITVDSTLVAKSFNFGCLSSSTSLNKSNVCFLQIEYMLFGW